MFATKWETTHLDFHRERKKAALTILNHLVKWPLSYINLNAITHYRFDAAHKLFNQIDCYITNWVGYCHLSSIFLWSRSPVSTEDTLWMMSMRWNETPHSPTLVIWVSSNCYSFVHPVRTAGNADVLIFNALWAASWGNWALQQIKRTKLFSPDMDLFSPFLLVRLVWLWLLSVSADMQSEWDLIPGCTVDLCVC